MKKWYKEAFFDRRAWILENFDKLNLTSDETLVVLLIDYARISNTEINNNYLANKLKKDTKEIDSIISSLVAKGFLSIEAGSKGVVFNIDSLFDEDLVKMEQLDNKDVYDIYSDLIGKPATVSEMEKINDLISEYGDNKVKDAMRIAEAYRKYNLSYIESILRNEVQ